MYVPSGFEPLISLASFSSSSSSTPHPLLQGQQYSDDGLLWSFYGRPRVSSVSPISGPLVGGTLITLHGQSLGGGTQRRCRFVVPTPAFAVLVGATVDATVANSSALLCRTPARVVNRTQQATLEVTLNAQQYSRDGVAFRFFTPPVLSAVYPIAGPTDGGTILLLSGAAFADYGARHSLPAQLLSMVIGL